MMRASVLACLLAVSCADATPRLDEIRVPDGFVVSLFADGVPNARSLSLGPDGVVFVGNRKADKVWALVDADGDGVAERKLVVAEGMDTPNGVAYRDGALWVAEISRILRYDGIDAWLENPQKRLEPVVVRDDLPDDRHHGWKFIGFGPDGLLYVPVGAPCNICDPGDPYAAILRMRPDGTEREVFARGVRNTVGFDWHPATADLWFTDNGRDWLGDDAPPDELNHAPKKGMHFGFPYCHGGDLPDPEFGGKRSCDEFTAPARKLGPHVAALGMRFYTGESFPAEFRGQIFLAEHGSWNRSSKIGYQVSLVRLEGNRVVSYEPFATGWLQGEKAWGRPVDVEIAPDGSLLVSDDRAGAVYRIRYEGGKSP
jgi:glucose/arabinose dehydrogenase